MPAQFSGQRAFDLLRETAERFPDRVTGSAADDAAAAWVGARFADLGLEVSDEPFAVWGVRGVSPVQRFAGRNVVGISRGSEPRAVVIGAHRDVVPDTVQGAEDNASGTAAMLELARVLGECPHQLTYVFVSFGAEEIGLGGSRHYLAHAPLPTALMLSVDMVGRSDGRRLFLADGWSLPLAAARYLGAQALAADLLDDWPRREWPTLTRLSPSTIGGVTDSLPFAVRGQPAVGVGWSTPPYPQAHTEADSIDRLSPASLSRAGQLVERFVRGVDADPTLLAPAEYLLPADGRFVGPGRIRLAAALLVGFAVAQWGLAVVGLRRRPAPGLWGPLIAASLATAAWAGLGALVSLALPSDVPPGPILLLAGGGWWALCVALPSVIRRRLPPWTLAERHAEIVTACTVSYLGFSLLVNPFFALLAAGYPMLVLSWLPGGLTRRARAIGWLLLGPWSAVALAALLVSSIASVLVPELVPPGEAALASILLLWPLAVGLGILRDRRDAGMLASTPAFR
jgi:aminopeptidase YwaD